MVPRLTPFRECLLDLALLIAGCQREAAADDRNRRLFQDDPLKVVATLKNWQTYSFEHSTAEHS